MGLIAKRQRAGTLSDGQLAAARDNIMKALSQLSTAAKDAKEVEATRFANDLQYACNRAWHELDRVARRQGL
jgi:hypothetical protein